MPTYFTFAFYEFCTFNFLCVLTILEKGVDAAILYAGEKSEWILDKMKRISNLNIISSILFIHFFGSVIF